MDLYEINTVEAKRETDGALRERLLEVVDLRINEVVGYILQNYEDDRELTYVAREDSLPRLTGVNDSWAVERACDLLSRAYGRSLAEVIAGA